MDQRSAARHRILRAATIEFGGSTIPCMVRNMSDAGARLRSIAEHRASPILEVVMLDAADALPLAVERAEPPWRQAVERSVQDHCDVSDKPEIGRNAFSPYNHRGTVVVASAWLVFYVIAAIHHFIAS